LLDKRVQLLTLASTSWSRRKIAEEFGVSEYTAPQARELLRKKGIIAIRDARRGKKVEQSALDLVHSFYQSHEYSRTMPGMKDKIIVLKNVHMQKRLPLSSLNAAFKLEYHL
jgi:DNA-binding GntR family transcriptional regulator